MIQSLFIEYIDKYFKPIIQRVVELINGKKEEEALLYKQMLTPEYSADLKWGTKEINRSIVAADVVSMESSLPLKKRDTISIATGDIPKLGMKLRKGEKTIKDIQIMQAAGATEAQVAQKIFEDTPKVIKGIEVRKEIMFLEALSSGTTLIEDDTNTGTGIRVDFGYRSSNTVSSAIPWGIEGYTPEDDMQSVFDKADTDGNTIALVMMSKKYFNYFKNSTQGKKIYANYAGIIYTNTANLPVPGTAQFLGALEDKFGCKFRIVNSSFRVEKDGTQTSIKPWTEQNIVFLYDGTNVGRLVYGTCAEHNNHVEGVRYETAEQGTLVSKYSRTDPLEEFTAAQAIAIPVIDGVESIYLLEAAKGNLVVSPTSLSFSKAADSTGKTVTATTNASTVTATVPEAAAWLTATESDKVVTFTVAANSAASAPERSADVIITDANGATATITVTQAANS